MDACLDYIYEREGRQQETMFFLHHLIMSYPEVTGKIRFKIPFYFRKSWICYLNPLKQDRVELVFLRGNELSNEQGLLESRGRKQVLGLIIERVADIPEEALHEILQEALLLDETIAYASKRRKI
ncbi:MAG TPA: DUF1801 domain-containing protein [Saprospiraceae bacterium]|mgnify:CR=1 FL=1|nr:DUF1801 domain-containing protein [Saprospiraceae bacterium]HMP12709.1 DUF1801 domain-containing protein [Saprospiraceae bacterium]